MTETIAAVASAAGAAGVAIIRVSGAQAKEVLATVAGGVPPPRQAIVRRLRDPGTDEVLDRGVVLFFPGPASFTGEDVCEFQVHGGRAVVAAVLSAILSVEGVRLARAGEFTHRAFRNGKMDLVEAEGLADLIAAETEAQRRQALRQMEGEASAVYAAWREGLLDAAALLEAAIDFPDEDMPDGLFAGARAGLVALSASMEAMARDADRGSRVRDGLTVVILGPPNAGKSSLINALARREVAIVSSMPGTTRDLVETRLILSGLPVWIADTAGLRETEDGIEAEGIRRARARAGNADIRVWVEPPEGLGHLAADLREDDIVFRNKIDLDGGQRPPLSGALTICGSAAHGEGVARLEAGLAQRVEALTAGGGLVMTRARHREAVEGALEAVRRALSAPLVEAAAEDVRRAVGQLEELIGRLGVDDIYDRVFSRFCIGK
jgi:tRNA modification GTPase